MSKYILASTLLLAGHIASFINPHFSNVTILMEWNGPDIIVNYSCQGTYTQLHNLHMVKNNDIVSVNYGALGRRRYTVSSFECHTPTP